MIPLLQKLPYRIRITVVMLGLYLCFFTLFRIGFFFIFIEEMGNLSLSLLFKSLLLGLRFDARLSILIILPFLLLSLFTPLKRLWSQNIWRFYWLIIIVFILCIYISDIAYYSYLNTRLDASIIGLLKNFTTSTIMLWETYPVIPFILFFAGFIWLFVKIIDKIYPTINSYGNALITKKSVCIYFIFVILLLGIGYGKWSRYPLRWSDAFYSTNHSANQLSINPVLYLINSYSSAEESYELNKVRKYYDIVSEYMAVTNKDSVGFTLRKKNVPKQKFSKKPNVIIIFLETFPTYKIGYFGNPLNTTPNFDKIARNSIIFLNFYVPKFSTAASIFSAMTGLPDVSIINKSSTRDPFAHRQHLLLNDLKGYRKHFFIGGSANWGDLGGFFRGNVNKIKVHEEGTYSASEINAWGISDYDLFMEAHNVFIEEQEPFISVILTAGHHPPFSIPDIDGFEHTPFTEKYKKNGFSNQKDLNAFRFMDYSLGEFINSAKEEKYFENTIFVILGDHGFGHSSQPNLFGALSLHNFHVPLTIFSPGLNLKHKEISDVASSIDLMPTIMGLLSVPYVNTTLGKNLLQSNKMASNAFIFTATNSTYGLISNNYYVISNVDGSNTVYDMNNNNFIDTANLEINKMKELNNGFYHISKFLRYHNE